MVFPDEKAARCVALVAAAEGAHHGFKWFSESLNKVLIDMLVFYAFSKNAFSSELGKPLSRSCARHV
jgi:hypothetical protein